MQATVEFPVVTNNHNLPSLSHPRVSASYDEAMAMKRNAGWAKLETISVHVAIADWLNQLTSSNTRRNYESAMNVLIARNLLDPLMNLQQFVNHGNHNSTIDRIKAIPDWSEASKQARAAAFIAFTKFLHRKTDGLIPRAIPCSEGTDKTFFKVREKVKTAALNEVQWLAFFEALEAISDQYLLIGELLLQGAKRLNEVLSLETNQIDWANRQITFSQSKTRGVEKKLIVTCEQSLMDELREFIGERTGLVFLTNKGSPVQPIQVQYAFRKAGEKAGIPFRMHPHVLRASGITAYLQRGASIHDVSKLTGQDPRVTSMYDKSDAANNASARISLVA